MTIRQHINCVIALDNSANSTDSLIDFEAPSNAGTSYGAIAYAASPTHLALSQYTAAASYFSNVNVADCGGFTSCELLPSGCSGTYAGLATMHATTFALSIT